MKLGTIRAAGLAGLIVATGSLGSTVRADDTEKKEPTVNVKIGGVIFADYTYTQEPKTTDAAGNSISPSAFNLTRAYINVIGTVSDWLAFRVTPDITRVTGTGGNIDGNYDVRIKYAFLQFNLDKWTTKGSWVRLGVNQTPYVDYTEGIYRYRFQGTIFAEREGYLSSSDTGVSARFTFPKDYGDVHFGVYNGEGYSKPEANDQQAFQVRATVRPAPGKGAASGLRISAFYDKDSYVRNARKERLIGQVTFEHPWVKAGAEYLDAKDQTLPTATQVDSDGWTVWAEPKIYKGLEALLRYDQLTPDKTLDARKKRGIVGLSYWFPTAKGATTALLLDYENVKYDDYAPAVAEEKRWALHATITF